MPLRTQALRSMTEIYKGAFAFPVSQTMMDDSYMMREFIERAMDNFAVHLMWRSLGSRNPWPKAGFDFRENSDRNRYPEEPEYCDCCGQRVDDCDD